ncbi:MAG: ABC transporter ATP-binding protein [Chitinispirillaceae bacterium]|nr:ABC transporter ATP-binding protein [Chitinispirillaceae bacterium]
MADVVLKSLMKRYANHVVADRLTLTINDGEFVTLLGPSGCGKTTLLRMIAGLEKVDEGEIVIGGRRYTDLPAQKRNCAMVFQSYALFPHMTVRNNIIFGLRLKKVAPIKIEQKLTWAMNMLHLKGLEERLPRQISGGQRQRVALARALVLDPDVLLLDEPLSNLDAALRETAIEELKNIHRKVGTTIIYVTHNQIEAMTMSERIALLNNGRIEQYDTPRQLYDHPATIFTAEFVGSPSMNFFKGEISIEGRTAGVRTSIGFLRLNKDRSQRIMSMEGKEVTVGIRPQNIYYVEHVAQRRYTDANIELVIELVENMGDRSLIVGKDSGGTLVRFMVTREEELLPGRTMRVFIDGRSIHLFDPLLKLNIFRRDGTI